MDTMTFGADPELMLLRRDTGKLVSAIPLLKGTKADPCKYEFGYTMRDNVNAEFAINPANSKKELVHFIAEMLKCIKKEVGELYQPMILPSANFPKEELLDREALAFGCDADFNGWTWKVKRNIIPVGANKKPFRTCGGHIHIGHPYIVASGFNMIRMVKLEDFFLGIPSVVIDCRPDAKKRRQLYGKAGCFRAKPYGVEWRTASNFWIGSPQLTELVYDLTSLALKALLDDTTPARTNDGKPADPVVLRDIDTKVIQSIINESDTAKAKEVLETVLIKHIGDDLVNRILSLSKQQSLREVESNWNI